MFDPNAYGDEIAGILALDGNGERLMPLAGATCRSAEARRLLKASRLPPAVLAGLYLYFSCWDEAHGVAQDLDTPEGSYWHALVHRQGPDAGDSGYWCGRARWKSASSAGVDGTRWRSSTTAKRRESVRVRRRNERRSRSSARSGNCSSIGAPKWSMPLKLNKPWARPRC